MSSNKPQQVTPLEVKPVEAKSQGIVEVAVSVEQLAEHYKRYEEVKDQLLNNDDYVVINDKKAIAKSGWFKLGVAFNLDTLIISENRREKDDIITWEIAIQCRAPNGRVVQEIGVCDDSPRDREEAAEHVIKAMAMTRATERAYIKMLGAPDSAADDMSAKNGKNNKTKFCECKEGPATKTDGKCATCNKFSKLWWDKNH